MRAMFKQLIEERCSHTMVKLRGEVATPRRAPAPHPGQGLVPGPTAGMTGLKPLSHKNPQAYPPEALPGAGAEQ